MVTGKKRNVPEHKLVDTLFGYLQLRDYRVLREVPNMGQSVDLVAIKNRWVYCIEVKISDWRRAIEQCRAHEAVADLIYLAMPESKPSQELVNTLETYGYGLILVVDGKIKMFRRAKRNRLVWKPQRKVFMTKLNTVVDA